MTSVEYWSNKLDKALCIASHIRRIIEGANPQEMLERVEREEKEIYEALVEAEQEVQE